MDRGLLRGGNHGCRFRKNHHHSAVEYSFRRPQYQPFEVVSILSGNLILRSLGSDDFVWDMVRDLTRFWCRVGERCSFMWRIPREWGRRRGGDGQREDGGDTEDGTNNHDSNSNSRTKRKQKLNPNVKQVKGPLEGSRAAVFYDELIAIPDQFKSAMTNTLEHHFELSTFRNDGAGNCGKDTCVFWAAG